MVKAKVYLVGAGPGDAELITLKGVKLLGQADIVLYDYLVNIDLLSHCSTKCKKIYVGKREGQHTFPQKEINRMLVEYTKVYNCVVRLKGGDPFVFGRGAEEIETLIAHDIDYEVVPGVTSGVAVPAYMGIPVTARNVASSVVFVTGHSAKKISTPIDFKTIGQVVDTIVVYMGVTNASRIARDIIQGGRDPETPVALIRSGTYPEQEIIKGKLENIKNILKEAKFKPPALMIIGEVVNFSDKLKEIIIETDKNIIK